MTAGRRKRLISIGALLVLLGAILPNVVWLGHWPADAATANPEEHAGHCHGESSCADGGASGLQWLTPPADAPALEGDSQRSTPPLPALSPREPSLPLPDPPPRPA